MDDFLSNEIRALALCDAFQFVAEQSKKMGRADFYGVALIEHFGNQTKPKISIVSSQDRLLYNAVIQEVADFCENMARKLHRHNWIGMALLQNFGIVPSWNYSYLLKS